MKRTMNKKATKDLLRTFKKISVEEFFAYDETNLPQEIDLDAKWGSIAFFDTKG